MSQTLNKSSNSVTRDNPTSNITSTFVKSPGHSLIPVLLPQRNFTTNPSSLLQCPSQAFLLSDPMNIANPNSADPNHLKNPPLAVRVVSNASLNNASKIGKNAVSLNSTNHLANGTAGNVHHQPQPIAMKTSKVSTVTNSKLQAPHILPKQLGKVKVNNHPINQNLATSNNPVSIFSQNNVSSRVIYQKFQSASASNPHTLDPNLESEGKSSQILSCVSTPNSNTTSIPIVNPTRQVNLMMLSGASAGQALTNNPISNTLVIGNAGQIANASTTANVVQLNSKTQQITANKNIGNNSNNGTNYHPGITFSNVLVSPTQTGVVNNSGILIKQQTQYQSTITPVSSCTPAISSSVNPPNSQSENSCGDNVRPMSVPIMVASSSNRPVKAPTIDSNSVTPGVIRGVSVNHSLGGTFITTNQLQTISTPTPHVNIISQNSGQTPFSTNPITAAASFSNNNQSKQKRSRKQILQTGTSQVKTAGHHSNQSMLHHSQVIGNAESANVPPGPTTALLITASSTPTGANVSSSNNVLGSNSSTTCSSINLTSSNLASSGNNGIIGLRLVPMKPQNNNNNSGSNNIVHSNIQPAINTPSAISTLRLASAGSPVSNQILIQPTASNVSGNVVLTNCQSNSSEAAHNDQTISLVPHSNTNNNTHEASLSSSKCLLPNNNSNIVNKEVSFTPKKSGSIDIIKTTVGSPYSENEHEIAKSLISTCHELEKTKDRVYEKVNSSCEIEEGIIREDEDESPTPSKQKTTPHISHVDPNLSAKAHHFQTRGELKMKSIEATFGNSFLSLIFSDILKKDALLPNCSLSTANSASYSTALSSSRKRILPSHASKRGGAKNSNLDNNNQINFKRDCYLLWNTLLDLRIKQSRTQFVKYPIATTSTLDVTGWRLLQSTNNLEFLKNSEFHACTSLHNIESILCNYITSKKLLSSDVKNFPRESGQTAISSKSFDNNGNHSDHNDGQYLSINAKRPRTLNGGCQTAGEATTTTHNNNNKNSFLIRKLDKTLDLIKGLQQRQKILWDRMSGLIDMTNGLMDNHRYPALQIFDDLSVLLSQANNNHHQGGNLSLANIEPITDSDETNQSEESLVNT